MVSNVLHAQVDVYLRLALPSFVKHYGRMPTLDEWINERRIDLGMRLEDLATAAGITREALRQIRHGGGSRLKTDRDLEDALQWERGSLNAIRNGGQPTERDGDDSDHGDDLIRAYQALKKTRGRTIAERWLQEGLDALNTAGTAESNARTGPA
jgi:transcriptional regulator with XRE-family HTH domain